MKKVESTIEEGEPTTKEVDALVNRCLRVLNISPEGEPESSELEELRNSVRAEFAQLKGLSDFCLELAFITKLSFECLPTQEIACADIAATMTPKEEAEVDRIVMHKMKIRDETELRKFKKTAQYAIKMVSIVHRLRRGVSGYPEAEVFVGTCSTMLLPNCGGLDRYGVYSYIHRMFERYYHLEILDKVLGGHPVFSALWFLVYGHNFFDMPLPSGFQMRAIEDLKYMFQSSKKLVAEQWLHDFFNNSSFSQNVGVVSSPRVPFTSSWQVMQARASSRRDNGSSQA